MLALPAWAFIKQTFLFSRLVQFTLAQCKRRAAADDDENFGTDEAENTKAR